MSKRSAPSGSPARAVAKRQKRILDDTSRLSTAALLAEQSTSSVSSYLSVRQPPASDIIEASRPLTSLCLEVIVESFAATFLTAEGQLRREDDNTRNSVGWLKLLSPKLANRLLRRLMEESQLDNSTRLTVSAMTDLFLRSKSITTFVLPPLYFRAAQKQYDPGQRLDDDPENVLTEAHGAHMDRKTQQLQQAALKRARNDRSHLFAALGQCGSLRSLILSGQASLEDRVCVSMAKDLALLEEINLKGCTSVGDETVTALARGAGRHGNLKIVNLNYTAVTVKGLKSLFARCKTLEVLKLANINGLVSSGNWLESQPENLVQTDNAVQALLDPAHYLPEDWQSSPFLHLTSLKLRSTKIGDQGLKAFISLAPKLTSLDISYTSVRSLDALQAALQSEDTASLEKLVMSGLQFRLQNGLQRFFQAYSRISDEKRNALKTLKLGTLGLIDSVLAQIVPHLARMEGLVKVSLFSNSTLASGSGSGMRRFLEDIGRRCRVLDLSHVPIRSRLLAEGLLAEIGEDSKLEVLVLNNTAVNNDAAVAICMLPNLEELYLEQSRIDGKMTLPLENLG